MKSTQLASLLLSVASAFADGNNKPSGFGQRPPQWIEHNVAAEFASPSGLPRPSFRYWVPDSDVADEVLYADLRSIKNAGWDGAQIICLENYGIELAVVDPAVYGYGGVQWREKFNVMLQAAQELNLTIDFALGPTQGASIPILDPDSPGMNTELAYGSINLTAGQKFQGALPQPVKVTAGYANAPDFYPPVINYTNKFVAAVLARKSNSSSVDPRTVQLDYTSVIDVTNITSNGSLAFVVPTDGDYVLLAFWQRRTGYLAAQGAFDNATDPDNPASWFAYVVDHYSQEGTDLWTSFTEQYVMNGGNGDLMRQLALYAWEDSAEFRATLFWTDDFISFFEHARGYNPVKALACQFGTSGLPPSTLNNSYFYYAFSDTAGEDISWKLHNDYWQALQEAYETYHLEGLSKWSATWGLQGSIQPYATAPQLAPPWDMNSAAAHIDAPETESNYFDGVIDAFRAMGGGAMMGQKQILSSELGAHRYFAYAATWPLIINDCQQNYAGGVNRIVTHGFPYSGWRPDTQWPGLTTFEWTYSEMWGPRQPSWQYAREFGDWIARTQLVLQSGKPRVDVGIYRHKYLSVDIKHYGMGENIFGDASLADEGYSYVSVSPSLLLMDNAVVDDGLLASDGPGFSAFIVDNSTNITSEAVTRFLDYAGQGFPIIFVGGLPQTSPYYCESCDDVIKSGVNELLSYSSVKNLSTEAEVVPALQQLGILPTAHNLSPSPILYVHRVDELNGVDFFWAYNSDIYFDHATEVVFSVSAATTPYELDAWTGAVTPLLNYTLEGGRFRTWVALRSNASTIFAFAPSSYFADVEVPTSHVVATDCEEVLYSPNENVIIARSTVGTSHVIELSDNRTAHLNISEAALTPATLGPWQLSIREWLPNPDPWENYTSVFAYHNYTLDELVPWYNISSALANSSGVGTYTSQFSWPPANNTSAAGAYLDLGYIFMTARLYVNGDWAGPVDVFSPVVDIGPFLTNGTNEVRIEVSTTLRNRLLQVNVTQSWEQASYSSKYGPQAYGLARPVLVKPYGQVKIPVAAAT
ncbi:hypothetical protein LTR36_000415 [Oleoguttula mirabilis]|uniref:Secreted protein n=1 Tax=Oleoguttula mirabilis TaxID=1507867 RepID=A0AAV9JYY6_9PEZI|nr:hypothetical protein LTR36_000415 [Oleoguttula mirabilis]